MSTATTLFTHPACLAHDVGGWHPECPDRLRAVLLALEDEAFAPLLREEAPKASIESLRRVHPDSYIATILAPMSEDSLPVPLDADTVLGSGTAEAALRAAGGAVAAVDAVMEGWARSAFVATRPPGHHAEPAQAMGFCFFANAAIAALHARARWGVRRVAVVDFDVHHGNGTEAVFAADPDLFYGSTHQMPCYPGTGSPFKRGVANNIRNMALHPGDGGAAFRGAWTDGILPDLDRFAPELLIISAGFDAHRADPLAELRLEVDDFTWITNALVMLADRRCGGRVVSVLEGGYNLDALARSAAAHVRALMHADA
jgi:acetoin utilization deacetylase AcuC-like enzyme